MKKLALCTLILVLFALRSGAQIAFGPEAGLYMANLSLKTDGKLISSSFRKSFTFGATLDHGFTDNIYIQPGLFYVMNGCTVTDVGWYKINTIQVPVYIQYKFGTPGGVRLFVGIGPHLGYIFSGNSEIDRISSTLKIGNNKKNDDTKPIDLSMGLNVGLQLAGSFYMRIQYQLGLNDLNPGGDAQNSSKTYAIGITVGYYFGDSRPERRKKKKK